MAKHYVTFGLGQVHKINGNILDEDTVAVYEANSNAEGREKAFEYFGKKFFTDYHDTDWNEDKLKYYSKGYVKID